MNIADALKQTNIRIIYANRWLVWDVPRGAWIVYDDGPKNDRRKTRAVVTTINEEEAVKYLLYKDDEWRQHKEQL